MDTTGLPEERREQLSLPPAPVPFDPRTTTIRIGVLLLLVFLLGIFILVLSYSRLNTGLIAVNGFCLSGLMVLGPLFYWPQFCILQKNKAARRLEEIAAWDQAKERWARMLYCRRDDLVFDPNDNTTCSPEDLHDKLRGGVQLS